MSAQDYIVSISISCAIALGGIGAAVAQVPNNLEPNPNLLLFPTKPEEVTIQTTQPITFQQALELVKRNNLEYQRASLEVKRSIFRVQEVQAGLFPSVSLNANITRSLSAASELSSQQLRQQSEFSSDRSSNFNQNADTITSFSGTGELVYGLYNYTPSGLGTYNINTIEPLSLNIAVAEEQVEARVSDAKKQLEDIRLTVAENYYDLQQADENVRIQQSAVINSEASLRDALALERAGVGTRFDVLRSQTNLADAQQNLTSALSSQIIARRQLAARLNIPQSMNLSAADPVQLAGLWNQTLEDSIIAAYQNRRSQSILSDRQIALIRQKIARSGLKPQVTFNTSYNLLDVFNDNTRVSDGYSIGIQANQILFDGGAAKARAEQQRITAEIAEVEFDKDLDEIRLQVEEAYANQQSNLANVQTANVALEQAQEALRLARLRFQAGVGTQTDVINAQNDLVRAEGNRVQAILDYNRSLAQLQRYVSRVML